MLKNLSITESNQVWQIDIIYIPMAKGFMYLVAIIDVHSRFVVGWDISNNMDADWVLETLQVALASRGKPQIVNSDQGSQFTCKKWIDYLKEQLILISMDGKGRAIDNVYIERLWRTVKYDYVYFTPPEDGWQLYQGLKEFFERYNNKKYHQGVGRQLPVAVYYSSLASSA
ncbi:IS3 family transposase [Rhodocytophaga rosea]|uniref:IS3 family transposase n=1 Tax=Rhodocytophaga rosea TaxID=2704465 RepID=UPI003743476A